MYSELHHGALGLYEQSHWKSHQTVGPSLVQLRKGMGTGLVGWLVQYTVPSGLHHSQHSPAVNHPMGRNIVATTHRSPALSSALWNLWLKCGRAFCSYFKIKSDISDNRGFSWPHTRARAQEPSVVVLQWQELSYWRITYTVNYKKTVHLCHCSPNKCLHLI